MEPDASAIEAAKAQGEGWVLKLEGDYSPDEAVPPQAIVGAWKVQGRLIVGEFVRNPNYIRGWPKRVWIDKPNSENPSG
jgi:hypothetical protein